VREELAERTISTAAGTRNTTPTATNTRSRHSFETLRSAVRIFRGQLGQFESLEGMTVPFRLLLLGSYRQAPDSRTIVTVP
jgi:hypothetical protein